MKQVLLIVLLTSYTLSTLGIGVKQFYCCGKLKSTDITIGLEKKETCAKDDGKDGCCNTKVQTLKVKDSHFGSDITDLPVKHLIALVSDFTSFDISIPVAMASNANATHAPPNQRIIPLNILHCIYRI